jgi:hypothetical protein
MKLTESDLLAVGDGLTIISFKLQLIHHGCDGNVRSAPPHVEQVETCCAGGCICSGQTAVYFGAREATIFSKRGSPLNGSQNGSRFN